MLPYTLIFSEQDYKNYKKFFDKIYKNKYMYYNFKKLYSHNITQYNFLDNNYITSILNQSDGYLKYNMIISDIIYEDMQCIDKHLYSDNNKYIHNTNDIYYTIQFQSKEININKVNKTFDYNFYLKKEKQHYILSLTKNDKIENIIKSLKNINNIINASINHNIVKPINQSYFVEKNSCFADYNQIMFWNESTSNIFKLENFDNIFLENWYNKFKNNIILFFNNI